MSRPKTKIRIEAFLIDEDNEAKFAMHGLSLWQVLQVLDNEHLVVQNRRRRRASYLVIGRDHGGNCIAIPVESTHKRALWRPVTAWPCKNYEKSRLELEVENGR